MEKVSDKATSVEIDWAINNPSCVQPAVIQSMALELQSLRAKIAGLPSELEALKRTHYQGEDCWYNCPKSDEGCCDDQQKECNCGASVHNKKIDELRSRLEDK